MLKKKILRKFGFKLDQQGIIKRYLRESDNWKEHLKKTKDFIIDSAQNKEKKTAVILGSGWLLDVPFEELSLKFKKLILVDIIHPSQITNKLKNYSNIELAEADITGLVNTIYETTREKKKILQLGEIKPIYESAIVNAIQEADFVVSVNLLNQLDILICDYLIKLNKYNTNEIDEFRKYIQNNHIQLLPKGKSTLITDYEELNLDDKEQIISRKKLVHIDLPGNKIVDKWSWKFDLNKTYHSKYKTIFKVFALHL